MRAWPAAVVASTLLAVAPARAQPTTPIGYVEVVQLARLASPDVASVRAQEAVARSGIGVAGTYPNPTFSIGTSNQTALVYGGVSVPLVVFGQIGAARDASRAELATARADTRVSESEVRAAAAHAFVALWLAQNVATERASAASIQARLEQSVKTRVEVGSAPEIDSLRTHAERLRADADAAEAEALVAAAGAALGRWIGVPDGSSLRADGDPVIPSPAPPLGELRSHVEDNPAIRRENADALAALARASHERRLAWPSMSLDMGFELMDPTLPGPNFRAQLVFDLPLFNHRGSYVERESNAAAAARARADAERARAAAELSSAYMRFEAVRLRVDALKTGVLPAAEAAALAIEDAYGLGRASLVTVLDAEKARVDARLALATARAEQADAWIEVERVLGVTR